MPIAATKFQKVIFFMDLLIVFVMALILIIWIWVVPGGLKTVNKFRSPPVG